MKRDFQLQLFFTNGKTYTKTVTYMPQGNLKATTVQTRIVVTSNDNILTLTEYLDDQQVSKLTFDEKNTVTTNHFGFTLSGRYYFKKSPEHNNSETIITIIKNKDTTNISKIIKCDDGSLLQISYKTKNRSKMYPVSMSYYSHKDSHNNILSNSSSTGPRPQLSEGNQGVVTDGDVILNKHFPSVKYVTNFTIAPEVNLTSGLLQVGLKETIESKYDVNGKLVSKIQKIFSVDGGLLSITSYNVNRSVVHIETNGSVLTGTWSFSKSPEYNNNDTIVSRVAGFSDAHGKNITFIKKSVLSPNNSRIEFIMKKENNDKWYVFGMGSHIEVVSILTL